MIIKGFVFFTSVITILFIGANVVSASNTDERPHLLIINQVRGEECCSPGSLENLQLQLEATTSLELLSNFNLRYDVLTDSSYTNLIKSYQKRFTSLVNVGLFLEVTPSLAEASGLSYKSPYDRWYEAQTAYSIGYTDDENKQIIDTLFEQFHQVFGYYPSITTAWMIDSSALNYMTSTYGVKVHQITREQWGTDSYTLYGGPPHYPYPARESWMFLPDYTRKNAPLIVRQTVTDPLYNYGDQTNAFTSQPNDYTIDGKTIEYFKKLLNQALFNQSQNGFALVGLETSMNDRFQKEFLNQLKYLAELKRINTIAIPSIEELKNYWQNQTMTVYSGSNIVTQNNERAYWITTAHYRIRLRTANDKLYISDVRLYDTSFTDPYTSYEAQKEGFWVVPFLLDSSLQVSKNENAFRYTRTLDVQPTIPLFEIASLQKQAQPAIEILDGKIQVIFRDNQNKVRTIQFYPEKIEFEGFQSSDFRMQSSIEGYPIRHEQKDNGFQLKWTYNDQIFIAMDIVCKSRICTSRFTKGVQDIEELRKSQYILLFPEPVNHPIDPKKTIVKLNNRYAVAGRNPIRLIISPFDEYGNLTTLPIEKITYTSSSNVLREEKNTYNNLYFIDFYADTPTDSDIIVSIDEHEIFKRKIFFAPHCVRDLKECLRTPRYGWWYINSFIGDKTRAIIEFMSRDTEENE